MRESNIDVLVSGNSVTLIHLLNVQPVIRPKDPKYVQQNDYKLVILEIEVTRQAGIGMPRITSESFIEENLPKLQIKDQIKDVKLKANLG